MTAEQKERKGRRGFSTRCSLSLSLSRRARAHTREIYYTRFSGSVARARDYYFPPIRERARNFRARLFIATRERERERARLPCRALSVKVFSDIMMRFIYAPVIKRWGDYRPGQRAFYARSPEYLDP